MLLKAPHSDGFPPPNTLRAGGAPLSFPQQLSVWGLEAEPAQPCCYLHRYNTGCVTPSCRGGGGVSAGTPTLSFSCVHCGPAQRPRGLGRSLRTFHLSGCSSVSRAELLNRP